MLRGRFYDKRIAHRRGGVSGSLALLNSLVGGTYPCTVLVADQSRGTHSLPPLFPGIIIAPHDGLPTSSSRLGQTRIDANRKPS